MLTLASVDWTKKPISIEKVFETEEEEDTYVQEERDTPGELAAVAESLTRKWNAIINVTDPNHQHHLQRQFLHWQTRSTYKKGIIRLSWAVRQDAENEMTLMMYMEFINSGKPRLGPW